MNLPTRDRGDWAILMSSLNAYFHVEFEMRAVEEELLIRKQGNKESVRDFITQLMYLARKAYGQDIEKREATVLKRLELGLFSASLRRTFDELMLEPGMTLSILQAALVQRETRDIRASTRHISHRNARPKTRRSPSTARRLTSRRRLSRRSPVRSTVQRLWRAPRLSSRLPRIDPSTTDWEADVGAEVLAAVDADQRLEAEAQRDRAGVPIYRRWCAGSVKTLATTAPPAHRRPKRKFNSGTRLSGRSATRNMELVNQRRTRAVRGSRRETSRQGKCAAIYPCRLGTVRHVGLRVDKKRCVAPRHHQRGSRRGGTFGDRPAGE